MLGQLQQKAILEMVNQKIDLPFISEAQEGMILEQAMNAISGTLSNELPQESSTYLNDPALGIEPSEANSMTEQLISMINAQVDVPYLDEAQEAYFLRMVVETIVNAMTKGNKLP